MGTKSKLLRVFVNRKGQLCDEHSHQPLRLAPNSHLHLQLEHPAQLLQPEPPFETVKRLVVPQGAAMSFQLKKTDWGTLTVQVRLLGDVWMYQDGEEKPARLMPVQSCEVESVTGFAPGGPAAPVFEPFRTNTLNQAYSMASRLFEPKRASNVGSAYYDMQVEGPPVYRWNRVRTHWFLRDLWHELEDNPDYWGTPTA